MLVLAISMPVTAAKEEVVKAVETVGAAKSSEENKGDEYPENLV